MTSYNPPSLNLGIFDKNVFNNVSSNIISRTTQNNTEITSPLSAFGELLTTQLTSICHLVFNYDVINNQEAITTINGGTITAATGLSSYANALTTGGGGILVYSLAFSSPSSQVVDLNPYHLYLSAGEIISFAVKASNACDVTLSVTWGEAW